MYKRSTAAVVAALLLAGCGTTSEPKDAGVTEPAAATAEATTDAATPSVIETPEPAPSATAATSAAAKPAPKPTKVAVDPNAAADSEPTLAYDEVQVSNAYVKALDTAMPMNGMFMTSAFMQITNLTDRDITLAGGTAAFAGDVQVHEVVGGKMQMKPGGLVIKAGTTEILKAGGNHIMFVNMPKKVLAGDEVTFRLRFGDGGVVDVTAPVKTFNAGNETYVPAATASASAMK